MISFIGGVSPARKRKDRLFAFACLAAASVAVLLLLILLYSVFRDGFGRLSGSFFEGVHSRIPGRAGIKAALWGTVWIVSLTAAIAVPIGIASALYLEEWNLRRNRWTEFVQLNIANLAGVPSIVYGLLGLALFVNGLTIPGINLTIVPPLGRSIIAGALTMALLILPMIIIVSQEALKAVPRSYRDGSYALGATRWQTIRGQVLPTALPGILTGIILSVSRAMGESAPLITIGAATYIAATPSSVSDRFTILPLQIFNWSSLPQVGYHEAAAAAIIVLLGVLLALNSIAIILRMRYSQRS